MTGRHTQDTVLQLALDVARGMAYMHDQQLCHGDLASKNVLLATAKGSTNGRRRVTAKVADFGEWWRWRMRRGEEWCVVVEEAGCVGLGECLCGRMGR
jgi:hypothetical protein